MLNIMLNNSYTETACVTMKMMEFQYTWSLIAWKKGAKLVAHDQSRFGQKFFRIQVYKLMEKLQQ